MKRRLFNLLAAVSLVLCVAAIATQTPLGAWLDSFAYGALNDPRNSVALFYVAVLIEVVEAFIPFWLALALTSVLPTVAAVRWYRRRGTPLAGCCRSCGYDLRATPDRCPECGTAAGPAA